MNIEEIREFCLSLPGVTEDIKWGNNLVFSVAGKLFCLVDLETPSRVSLKVTEDQFAELEGTPDIIQAPYFAKRKWVCIQHAERFSNAEWKFYLLNSYQLVKSGLPKKIQESLGG